uniref:Uncharacterized protein n=1 Tax=Acrobeloides nanus TaxID=290746 RepID=A0A914BXM0_9BILA
MKVLHLNGFSKDEKAIFVNRIRRNLIESLGQLLEACQKYRIVHESILQDQVHRFMKFRAETPEEEETEIVVPKDIAMIMNRIWLSAPVQMVYKRRWTYALLDSAKYFLDALEKIADPHYEPSVQDILQCRFRTTGTQEILFSYNKMEFKMVDVGGQRSERRKWIHCFDNVNMVLFVVALTDYDQKDPEDDSQ